MAERLFQNIQIHVEKKTQLKLKAKLIFCEALPEVLGNRGKRAFILGEQENKGQILRGTGLGEQRQYWGAGNIRKQIFDFLGAGE